MGLVTTSLAFVVRLVWFACAGLWLGTAYFLLMFLMSPFGTMASGKIFQNTQAIMFLKTDD